MDFDACLNQPRIRRQNSACPINDQRSVEYVLGRYEKCRFPLLDLIIGSGVPISLGRNRADLAGGRWIHGIKIVAELPTDKDVFDKAVETDRMRITYARRQERFRGVRQPVAGD